MAQRRPNRKKRIGRHKPERYNPLNRAVKKRVAGRWIKRRKKQKGEKEWKHILCVVAGMLLALAIMIWVYFIIKAHEDMEL